jgi:steroid delta-isomerase-like uncharacterized protein
MSAPNETLAQRVIEEIWNARRLELADELIAASFTHHDPNTPDLGSGPEGYKKLVNLYVRAFPDLHFSIEETISGGDTVVTRWKSTGTQTGDLPGIPATQKTVSIEGVTISHLQYGKVMDQWVSWDAVGMMRQLGVIPDAVGARGRAA